MKKNSAEAAGPQDLLTREKEQIMERKSINTGAKRRKSGFIALAAVIPALLLITVLSACGSKKSRTADFSKIGADRLLSFFTVPSSCTADVDEDPAEGRVIRLTSSDVLFPETQSPRVFLKYKELFSAAGAGKPDLSRTPCAVFRVKAEKVHNHIFQLLPLASITEDESTRTASVARVAKTGEWQNICVDLSGIADLAKLPVLRIAFEGLAGSDGESMLISSITFCTRAEAEKIAPAEKYELNEDTGAEYTLRYLHFNIQTENGTLSPIFTRADMFRDLVDELLPDVVGTQEATGLWRWWMDRYVFNGSYSSVGVPRSAKDNEGTPIYYRSDKFELVDSGTFWLSDTPDVPESRVENANYPRICTWARLKDRRTDTEFVMFNTHLDHNGDNDSSTANAVRQAELKVIIRFAQQFKGLPVFLNGDLNSSRLNSKGEPRLLYKLITGMDSFTDDSGETYSWHLADARLTAPITVPEDRTATMTKYYDERLKAYDPSAQPIDYIFYDPANTAALSYESFLLIQNYEYISDHLPLFAVFRIGKDQ